MEADREGIKRICAAQKRTVRTLHIEDKKITRQNSNQD